MEIAQVLSLLNMSVSFPTKLSSSFISAIYYCGVLAFSVGFCCLIDIVAFVGLSGRVCCCWFEEMGGEKEGTSLSARLSPAITGSHALIVWPLCSRNQSPLQHPLFFDSFHIPLRQSAITKIRFLVCDYFYITESLENCEINISSWVFILLWLYILRRRHF